MPVIDDEALSGGEKTYRLIVDMAEEGVWILNDSDRIVFVNNRLTGLLDYPKEELIGRQVYDLAEGKNRDIIHSGLQRRRSGVRETYICQLRKKGGASIWVIVAASALFDENGLYLGALGLVSDITPLKQSELRAIASEEKYRSLVESIYDIVWETDKSARFTYISPQVQDILGYRPEDVIGKTPFQFIPSEEAERVKSDTYLSTGIIKPFLHREINFRKKDGKIVLLDIISRPSYGEAGEFLGYRGLSRDITERKQAETALKEAKSHAELYVDLMSHDINNMNQSALGYLELAIRHLEKEGILSREHEQLIQVPVENLKNSSRLIDNVRKLSQEKTRALALKPMGLGDILRSLEARFQGVPGREVTINYRHICDCKIIANDLLEDVFSNLIGNAIKHSRGALTVDIDTTIVNEKGHQCCRITIEDNGPGIPDERKEELFTGSPGKRTMRSGLGLYLVKTLVDNFNGRIRVEDRVPGDHTKGAKLVVMLPAA